MFNFISGHHHQQPWARHWYDHRQQQPWPQHWSSGSAKYVTPFAFNNHYYDCFARDNGRGHPYALHHRHQPEVDFVKIPPPITTNLRIGIWARGGVKVYFRFHGGIGNGCCGIACRITEANTAARPLQLFDALGPIEFQNGVFKMISVGDFVKIPAIGPPVPPTEAEASRGTGVFLPVMGNEEGQGGRPLYPNRILTRKGMIVRGPRGGRDNGWQHRSGGQMKQEDTVSKRSVGGSDGVEKEECEDFDEFPIELLLPSEWTY